MDGLTKKDRTPDRDSEDKEEASVEEIEVDGEISGEDTKWKDGMQSLKCVLIRHHVRLVVA
jgi:hypothetical protein